MKKKGEQGLQRRWGHIVIRAGQRGGGGVEGAGWFKIKTRQMKEGNNQPEGDM